MRKGGGFLLDLLRAAAEVAVELNAAQRDGECGWDRYDESRKSRRSEEKRLRGEDARRVRAFTRSLEEELGPVAREASQAMQAAFAPLAPTARRLEHQGRMIRVQPELEPLLDEDAGHAAIAEARTKLAPCADDALARLKAICERYAGEAEAIVGTTREATPERIEAAMRYEASRAVKSVQSTLEYYIKALDALEQDLARMRREIAETRASSAFSPGTEPDTVLAGFRYDMLLGGGGLAAIADAIRRPRSPRLRALVDNPPLERLPRERIVVAPEDAGLLLSETLERCAVLAALDDMKLSGSEALAGVRHLRTLLVRIETSAPDARVRLDLDSARRIARALVLAAECRMNPIPRPWLSKHEPLICEAGEVLQRGGPTPETVELIARLDAVALVRLDYPQSQLSYSGFTRFQADLLRRLHAIAGLEVPSAGLQAWDDFVARRRALRTELLDLVSPFWRDMFTRMLDQPRGSDADNVGSLRHTLAPIAAIDEAQGKAMLAELAEVRERTKGRRSIVLATSADGFRDPAPVVYTIAGSAVAKLEELLKAPSEVRAEYVNGPPEPGPLGEFAALAVRSISPLRLIEGRLVENRFAEVEQALRDWATKAPASQLRTALLETRWETMRITDWGPIDRYVANPDTAAIKLDFSGHVTGDLTDPRAAIPFEGGWLGAQHFADDDLSPEHLREFCPHYPRPWTGPGRDGGILAPIDGLAPLVVALNAWLDKVDEDWSAEARRLNEAVADLARLSIYTHANRVLERELATRRFARAVPFIVGDHDFGTFVSVVHMGRA